MYKFSLQELEFSEGTKVSLTRLTVIVGPNNSGKTRTLRELMQIITGTQSELKVLRRASWAPPASLSEIRQAYPAVERRRDPNGQQSWSLLSAELDGAREVRGGRGMWPEAYSFRYEEDGPLPAVGPLFAAEFGPAMVFYLNTEQRLRLVRETDSPTNSIEENSLLHSLYKAGRETEAAIRVATKAAFGLEVLLDFFDLSRMRLRVGTDFSNMPPDPRDARQVVAPYEKLDDQGDGIRSYVGVVTALLTLRRPLALIDEPEAFLHPPHAYGIGEYISDQANEQKQVVLATHSSDVLRGVLTHHETVTIVRIARAGDRNTVRQLDTSRVRDLVIDPLLSSARVLEGVFYPGVIVVEADSDARFYHLVSRKLDSNFDVHFVNADNKQTIPRIMGAYRHMGVPCAGIVDFDVLNDAAEFDGQLRSLGMTDDLFQEARTLRTAIAAEAGEEAVGIRLLAARESLDSMLKDVIYVLGKNYSSTVEESREKEGLLRTLDGRLREAGASTKPWRRLKELGRSGLSANTQKAFDRLAHICSEGGLFINPCGELESLLTGLGIPYTLDKRTWITRALQLVPNLDVDAQKQPWSFVHSIHKHLNVSP